MDIITRVTSTAGELGADKRRTRLFHGGKWKEWYRSRVSRGDSPIVEQAIVTFTRLPDRELEELL